MTTTRADVAAPAEPVGTLARPARYLPVAVWAVLGVVVILSGVRVIGAPATLVLAGAWLLAAALQFTVPNLAGPVSWAAGVVLEVCLLVGVSAVLALVLPHTHPPAVDLLALAMPAVVGALGLGWGLRHRRVQPGEGLSARPGLAVALTLAVFAIAAWIGTTGARGAAWAMSGDARNHVEIVRHITASGGLHLAQLRAYPAFANTVTAMISSAGHRRGLAPGALMLHDAHALVATYVLAILGVSSMLTAAVFVVAPYAMLMRRRLPMGLIVLAASCLAISVSSSVLGTSLQDGFLSAYSALPLSIAACALGVHFIAQPGPYCLILLGLANIATFFTWTLLAAAPFGIAFVAVGLTLVKRRQFDLRRPAWLLALIVTTGFMVAMVGACVVLRGTLTQTFQAPGTIVAPPTKALYVLALAAVAIAFAGRRYRPLVGAAVGLVCSVAAVWLVAALPGNSMSSYYAVKLAYLTLATFAWLPLTAAIPLIADHGDRRPRFHPILSFIRRTGPVVALSAAVVLTSAILSPLPNPLSKAHDGWDRPSTALISATDRYADLHDQFIFWNWQDGPNDRLGDFWASMTWATNPAGYAPKGTVVDAQVWAYTVTGLADVCTLLRSYPKLQVVTSDSLLGASLTQLCGGLAVHIILTPKPS